MSERETLQQMAQRHIEEIILQYVDEFRESLGLDWYCLTLGKDGDGRPHKALSNALEPLADVEMAPNDPPAVSESAAGDDDEDEDEDEDLVAVCARIQMREEWPGPDWSQAPEWADGWVKQKFYTNGMWFTGNLIIENRGYGDGDNWAFAMPRSGKERWDQAPSFNYPGHWRDSLRQRP